jgi:catechol 2,3-dioxygenase-like lactoylglutathione lyase family enzyme
MTNLISHIATVEIPVSDLEKSIDFYIDILGAEVHFQDENNAMLTLKSKGVPTIYLVKTEEIDGLSFRNTTNDVIHSVIDFYTASLIELYEWLKQKNVEVGPLNIKEPNGFGGFGFKDPDGNWLSACNILHPGQ